MIIVRYFGGTLLGVPGLIAAYKTSASLVLQCTPIIQKAIEVNYILQFDYTAMNDVMLILKEFNCTILKNETQLFCNVEVGIPTNKLTEVLNGLTNLQNIELKKLN